MLFEKLRSISLPKVSKLSDSNDNAKGHRRPHLLTPNSERNNPLSPSTTNSTKSISNFRHFTPKKAIHAKTTEVSPENEICDEQNAIEDQESRDFKEYLEKCRKAEEEQEKKKKKMMEMEKRRKAVNLSPWAGRM